MIQFNEDEYWNKCLSNRMDMQCEVTRLITIGMGFYARYLSFRSNKEVAVSFLDFIEDDKRPFGNKCIASSIIFNLGWDSDWVMQTLPAPKYVNDQAMIVYEAVIEKLTKSDGEALWMI